MTITDIRTRVQVEPEPTAESARVSALRAMLDDPAEAANYDDIRRAIDYLIGNAFIADLAA
jgi:hypothetical protein